MRISASILNADFTDLRRSVSELEQAGIDSFHMDIMDGNFVDNISFGPEIVRTVKSLTVLPLITHLMIMRPDYFTDIFFKAGSHTVIVHSEVLDRQGLILPVRENMGISFNPDYDTEYLKPILGVVSTVLVMSVFPGFGGQKFIKSRLKTIEYLREEKEKNGYAYIISVDGGITDETARLAASAGAEELVVGAYLTKTGNPAQRVQDIKETL